MSLDKKAVGLSFNIYLGDPDDGVESVSSEDVLAKFETYRENLPFDEGLYGHITMNKGGTSVLDPIPDPIVRMLTSIARVLPYVLEGEPESILMQESEHGFLFEPNGDKVMVSVFVGNDAYEPEEYILEAEGLLLLDFGDQLIKMGERLIDLFKKSEDSEAHDAEAVEDLGQILEVARDAVKSAKLKNEHGIRSH